MSAILLLIAIVTAGHSEAIEICESKLDIAIMADASSSVCDGLEPCSQWFLVLQFSKNLVSRFKLGVRYSKVAYVTMSDGMKEEFDLNEHTSFETLLPAIDNVNCSGGEFTDLASTYVLETETFSIAHGERPEAANVLIAPLDGAPAINSQLETAISTSHQGSQMYVFVVCVRPRCTEEWAKGIASLPKKANETYFMVDDYCLLDSVIDILVEKICPLKFPVNPGIPGIPGSPLGK